MEYLKIEIIKVFIWVNEGKIGFKADSHLYNIRENKSGNQRDCQKRYG